MQISLTCKDCNYEKCESLKEKSSSNSKLHTEKCLNAQPSRHKTLTRPRPTKMKIRYTYGNHHRLDHTYAAAAKVSDVFYLQPIKNLSTEPSNKWFKNQTALVDVEDKQVLTVKANHLQLNLNESNECPGKGCGEIFFGSVENNDNDEINLKSTWLRNLCLEYHPSKSFSSSQVPEVICLDDTVREKITQFHFSRINGTLKQYQKNKKVHKNKAELSSSFIGNGKITKPVQEDKKRWIAALALIELAQSK